MLYRPAYRSISLFPVRSTPQISTLSLHDALPISGNQEQGELAAKWLMVLLAVWLPFLCLRCIQVGHIYLPTQGDIYKNERTITFWAYQIMFFTFSISVLYGAFIRHA